MLLQLPVTVTTIAYENDWICKDFRYVIHCDIW